MYSPAPWPAGLIKWFQPKQFIHGGFEAGWRPASPFWTFLSCFLVFVVLLINYVFLKSLFGSLCCSLVIPDYCILVCNRFCAVFLPVLLLAVPSLFLWCSLLCHLCSYVAPCFSSLFLCCSLFCCVCSCATPCFSSCFLPTYLPTSIRCLGPCHAAITLQEWSIWWSLMKQHGPTSDLNVKCKVSNIWKETRDQVQANFVLLFWIELMKTD